jgi:hypothetical protein
LDPPAVKTLKQKIPEVQKRIRLAIQAGQTTVSIDQLYRQLKDLRSQLHTKIKQHEDQQLHQYLNQGQLNFTLCGPTLNGAWRFFQTLAQKIKRKPAGLPHYTLYNELGNPDPAIWEASDVPAHLSACGWEQYRFALGHHRRNHPKSPFDEYEADRIDHYTLRLLHTHGTQQDQHDCPVLNSPLTDSEILRHLKAAPPDKSPGLDGISNRMLQVGGPEFQKSLCVLMNMIWEYEIYPYDWSKALVQPIYKGDAKPRVDPASYRGIYLTCMTTKLSECYGSSGA